MVPVFFGITIIVFILITLAPGNVVDLLAAGERSLSNEEYEAMRHSLGLDKPIFVRYSEWLINFLKGDLGVSYRTNRKVALMIGQRVFPTLRLTLTSMTLTILLGVPLGLVSAYRPFSNWNTLSRVLSLCGAAVPSFFLSLIGIYIFSVHLGWFPSKGMNDFGITSLGNSIYHLILPSSIFTLGIIGNITRQTRAACIEILGEEFVKTARSKGISEIRVLINHVLRNAMIPIIASIGLQIPMLIGGVAVVEQIFSWPGIGSLMVSSITSRDYPVILGLTALIAVVVLIFNLVLDIFFGLLDPKITYK
jgi:peptide/nickel transport system permease protein